MAETAEGVAALWGEPAGARYRAVAASQFRAAFASPRVTFWAAGEAERPAALLGVAFETAGPARVVCAQTLTRCQGAGAEPPLAEACLDRVRRNAAPALLYEETGLTGPGFGAAFGALGLTPHRRLLMARPLNHETSAALTRSNRTRPITPEDAAGAAEAFAGAYEHSPDRALCPEVADAAQAADFLERVASSAFGPSSLEYLRVAPAPDEEDGPLAGAAAGAEPAAGVGFILHVAVRPAYRGRGVGTALVAETCEAFRQAGLTQAGLGVSEENPARRIYERLGFRTKRQLMAYVWNPAS